MKPAPPLKVLVIDDSAANRRAISHLLEGTAGLTVVGRAADGEDGLKQVLRLKPDVITLDLEMPKVDGFTFLRLLMATAPTPVVVLSSYAHPADVFKALQLGAYEFVAKPRSGEDGDLQAVGAELVEKIRSARLVRRSSGDLPLVPGAPGPAPLPVVAVAASTGGPPAVQRLLEALGGLPVCVLVAQHMPPRFTAAFAARLDQALGFAVAEAAPGARLGPGKVWIAPGGTRVEVAEQRGKLALSVLPASAVERNLPSADVLFTSVARHLGARAHGVVLTGMGQDGAAGVRALAAAGATTWAEAESTAVVFGMPGAAIATGAVRHVLPLGELGTALARALVAQTGYHPPPR